MSHAYIPRLASFSTGPQDPYYLVHRPLMAAIQHASRYARGRLLDIGCGNKPYEQIFASRVEEYVGCDVEQSSLRKADILCSADQIPVADGSFDTVLCTQTIEHVKDPAALVAEARRVLKPQGCFLLSGPMYWHLHEVPHDYFRFTKYGFEHLLTQEGFAVLEIIANGGKWATLGQVLLHTLPLKWTRRPWVLKGINRLFAYLDDKYHDELNTINYLVVARKPQ